MSYSKPFTVAIVGGGIVGTVLAIALRHRNINVQLYERDSTLNEISASIGLNISAAEALKVCAPEAFAVFKECATKPADPNVSIEYMDGYNNPSTGSFAIPWDGVGAGLHRGLFLDALVKHIPKEIIHFNKLLTTLEETGDDEPIKLHFKDGTTAEADTVIGADGIGSHVRRYILGEHHASARARYAHQYVYRAVMSTEDALKIVSPKYTQQMTMWLGKGGHVVVVPMAHGELLGVTAVVSDPAPWPSEHKLVLDAKKEDFVNAFTHFAPEPRGLIGHVKPGRIDRWGLFDLAENPLPYYAKGRIVLVGDSAHATLPHMGSGAMTGIEDAAVLAELLGDERLQGRPGEFEKAYQAYNEVRVPRGHWLTSGSRAVGSLLDYNDKEAGEDIAKIEEKVKKTMFDTWTAPVREHARLAKESFGKRLAESA